MTETTDTPKPQVRAAGASDVDAIASIWHAGWCDGHLGHVPDELLAVRTPESFLERSAALIDEFQVIIVDDSVAGFHLIVDDEVEQFYVSRQYRGQGISDELMRHAEETIRSAGHLSMWLAVVAGNDRARGFYARQGWIDEGLFDYGASAGEGAIAVPSHRYVKSLSS